MGYVFERFQKERIKAFIIGFVHDSILVDAHEDHAERAGAIVKEIMENLDTSPFNFTVPLPLVADVVIDRTWAA
jgi:DNA polymerase I-like protein with 3'-5' exonuclease and polymerase domains